MDYEKIILDIISPLVKFKENISIILLEQENLRNRQYVIYCDKRDMGALIGRGGIVANAIREIVNIYAKSVHEHVYLKFEEKK